MNYYKSFLFAICIVFSPALFGSVEVKSELTDKIGSNFNLYLYSLNEETKSKTINVSIKLYFTKDKANTVKAIKAIKKSLFSKGFFYRLTFKPELLIFDIQIATENLSELEQLLAHSQANLQSILTPAGWIDVSILGALNAQRTLGFFHANWRPQAENNPISNNLTLKNIQYTNLNIEETGFYDLLAFFAYCSDVNNVTKFLRVGLEEAHCFSKYHNMELNDANLAIYKADLYEQLLVAKTQNHEYLQHLSIFSTAENIPLFNRLMDWLPSASLEKLSHSYNAIIANQIKPVDPDSVVPIVLGSGNKTLTNKLDLIIAHSSSDTQTFVFTFNNLQNICQSNRCKKALTANNIQFIKGNPSFLVVKFSELNNQKLQKDFVDSVLTEIFNVNPWLSSQDIKVLASGKNAYISSYLNRYFDSNLKNQKQISNFIETDNKGAELLVSDNYIGSLDWANDVLSRYWLGHELAMACSTAKIRADILGDFSVDFSHLSIEEKKHCFSAFVRFKKNLTEKHFLQAQKTVKNFIHSQIHEPVLNLIFTGYYQLNTPASLLESQLDALTFDEYKRYIDAIIIKVNSQKLTF